MSNTITQDNNAEVRKTVCPVCHAQAGEYCMFESLDGTVRKTYHVHLGRINMHRTASKLFPELY